MSSRPACTPRIDVTTAALPAIAIIPYLIFSSRVIVPIIAGTSIYRFYMKREMIV